MVEKTPKNKEVVVPTPLITPEKRIELAKEAYFNRVPVYRIETHKDPKTGKEPNTVKIIPFSDLHYGADEFDAPKGLYTLNYIKEHPNTYVIALGDWGEFAIPAHSHPEMMLHQIIPVSAQMQMIDNLVHQLRDRIICFTDDTHLQRIYNATGIDQARMLADREGLVYLPGGGYIIIQVNKVKYVFAVFHGSGGSGNPEYQLKKASKIWTEADLIAIAHIHKVVVMPLETFSIDKDGYERIRAIVGVRTGGYLGYPFYVKTKLGTPRQTGSPIIFLGAKEKSISVNTQRLVDVPIKDLTKYILPEAEIKDDGTVEVKIPGFPQATSIKAPLKEK